MVLRFVFIGCFGDGWRESDQDVFEKQPETSKTVEIEQRAAKIIDYLKNAPTSSRYSVFGLFR